MSNQQQWMVALDSARERFEQIAAAHQLVRWQEEFEFAVAAIRGNDKLRQCHPESIKAAIIQVAAIGLSLNTAAKWAYLVPHDNAAQLFVSYRGLVKAAVDSGSIADVSAYVVHEGDEFEPRGPHEAPIWRQTQDPKGRKIVAAVCIARTTIGNTLTEVMWASDLVKIKECAKTKKVWDQWPDEMAKKAVTKRAAKYWPEGNARLAKTIDTINQIEGGVEPTAAAAGKLTAAQANDIKALLQKHFPNEWKDIQARICNVYNVKLVSHIPADKAVEVTEKIMRKAAKAAAHA